MLSLLKIKEEKRQQMGRQITSTYFFVCISCRERLFCALTHTQGFVHYFFSLKTKSPYEFFPCSRSLSFLGQTRASERQRQLQTGADFLLSLSRKTRQKSLAHMRQGKNWVASVHAVVIFGVMHMFCMHICSCMLLRRPRNVNDIVVKRANRALAWSKMTMSEKLKRGKRRILVISGLKNFDESPRNIFFA